MGAKRRLNRVSSEAAADSAKTTPSAPGTSTKKKSFPNIVNGTGKKLQRRLMRTVLEVAMNGNGGHLENYR